jgi:F5/8 type C domain
MLCAIRRSIRFRLLSLAQLVSHLTPGFRRALGFSTFGLLCLLLHSSMLAREVTLAWAPAHDPNLAGYRLYYGYVQGRYEGVLDVGKTTTYTLTDLAEGQAHYFALAAYDVRGDEGELTQEVVHNGRPTDQEGDAEDNTALDQEEADQAESDSEPVLDAASEMNADEPDAMPAQEQDSGDDQDTDRAAAGTDPRLVPQSQLRIVFVDSEPLVGDGAAESAIDSRVETFWRTEMGARGSVHPHELVIGLGGEYMVRGFRYLPRQDGKRDGMVARYSFHVSVDGQNWGTAAAMGTFSGNTTEQEVTFPEKLGSFVRFVAHSEVDGKPWTSVAELNVLGTR